MKIFICCFAMLSCFSLISYAETITLKDGTIYTGNIPHQDDQVVYVIQKEDLIKIPTKDIKEIKQDEIVKKKEDFLNINNDTPIVEKNSELILKLGYDFFGEYSHKGHTTDTDSPKGLNFSAEYYRYINEFFGIGAGVTIQNSRDIGDIPGEFYFLPMYVSVKLRSVPTEPYKYGYVIGQLGYNFFMPNSEYTDIMENTSGGLYYAIGLGIVYNNVVFEILSSTNTGNCKVKTTQYDVDIKYVKHTFSVGYAF